MLTSNPVWWRNFWWKNYITHNSADKSPPIGENWQENLTKITLVPAHFCKSCRVSFPALSDYFKIWYTLFFVLYFLIFLIVLCNLQCSMRLKFFPSLKPSNTKSCTFLSYFQVLLCFTSNCWDSPHHWLVRLKHGQHCRTLMKLWGSVRPFVWLKWGMVHEWPLAKRWLMRLWWLLGGF